MIYSDHKVMKTNFQKQLIQSFNTHDNYVIYQKHSSNNSYNTKMNTDSLCPRHKQTNSFVCTFDSCVNRKMCEQCKTRQNLHFTQHANFIYRLKDFYDYSNSKELIPRLQKGIQDSQNFINSHKSFYHQQSRLLSLDFDLLTQLFREVSQKYKYIYTDAFDKEITMFDEELAAIKTLLKQYVYEKNQQESFFTRIFGNDSTEKQQIDELINKNSKAFKVRATIINLRSKIAIAKTNKTAYKSAPPFQARFEQLKDHFKQFTINFFDRLKELLSHQGSPTTLKNSIVSQSRLLSGSQVGQSNSSFSLNGSQVSNMSLPNLAASSVSSARSSISLSSQPMIKVPLPQTHPNVLNIIKSLKMIEYPPNLSMLINVISKGKHDQGPFKYSKGTYYGTYENGVRSGKGIFIFSRDGSFYEGTWENDNMCGYGRLITHNSYYEGQIQKGLAHGFGTFENSIKVYSGEWLQDKRHGRGQQVFKNKRYRYKGSFINDKYQGFGVLENEQFTYSGQFINGVFQGQGTIRYRSAQTFSGIFKNGLKISGRYQMPDGSYFQGQYENQLPHGRGEFRWIDGLRYIGEWRLGLQDGQGIQIRDGKQLRGLWKDGSWVRWI